MSGSLIGMRCSQPASRGGVAKPSRAMSIAGWNSVTHGSLPCSVCASSSIATAPGTPTEMPETTAASMPIGLPSAPRNILGDAPAGAVSRPS
jgi:hypothetical protein